LVWIHDHLSRMVQAGCRRVPAPWPTRSGATFVACAGRLWELSPWLDGVADFASSPTRAKFIAAVQTLARFHQSARAAMRAGSTHGASPAVAQRIALCDELNGGLAEALDRAARAAIPRELAERADPILRYYRRRGPEVLARLHAAEHFRVPLQVCHGDLWHDHVLFRGEDVTGLIDFGAMKVESRATDIARLLGSFAPDQATLWQLGLAAYEQIETLAESDRALVPVFDQSAVLLAGLNWLKWLLVERRQFDNWQRVLQRLDAIVARMAVAS
jgi:Ser/Thr protein kinase RdoA (MazF antagonist)